MSDRKVTFSNESRPLFQEREISPLLHRVLCDGCGEDLHVICLDGSDLAFSWRQVFPSQEVEFDERNLPTEVVQIHQESPYSSLIPEFVALLEAGERGNFILYRTEVSDILGVSRQLNVVHPDYPNTVFNIGGVGIVRTEAGTLSVLRVSEHDPSQTAWQYAGLKDDSPLMRTFFFKPDRTGIYQRSADPLGGYTLESSAVKFQNSIRASELVRGCASVPAPVMWGKYSGCNIGWIVTALPLFLPAERLAFLEIESFRHTVEDQMLLETAVYQVMMASRALHDQGYLHSQLHYSNWDIVLDNALPAISIRDWETVQDIRRFDKKGPMVRDLDISHLLLVPDEQLSAFDWACITELRKTLGVCLRIGEFQLGTPDRLAVAEAYSSIGAMALAGYFGHRCSSLREAYFQYRDEIREILKIWFQERGTVGTAVTEDDRVGMRNVIGEFMKCRYISMIYAPRQRELRRKERSRRHR